MAPSLQLLLWMPWMSATAGVSAGVSGAAPSAVYVMGPSLLLLWMPWMCASATAGGGSAGAPSHVPPLRLDGSCGAFKPLGEATAATADSLSSVRPYVIRSWDAACGAPRPANTPGSLLGLLGANATVQDLSGAGEAVTVADGETLGSALARQAAGERIYYQTPLHLRSAGAAATLCAALPRHLDNGAWLDCLGEPYVDELSAAQFSWMALFVGVGGTGMALHQDALVAHVWAVQRAGRKRFVFCPPSAADGVVLPGTDGMQTVDAFNASSWPPNFAPAKCFHTTVAAGDLVYWPSQWFHQSYQPERSVALSSFSLGRELIEEFGESAGNLFPDSNAELLRKIHECRATLP